MHSPQGRQKTTPTRRAQHFPSHFHHAAVCLLQLVCSTTHTSHGTRMQTPVLHRRDRRTRHGAPSMMRALIGCHPPCVHTYACTHTHTRAHAHERIRTRTRTRSRAKTLSPLSPLLSHKLNSFSSLLLPPLPPPLSLSMSVTVTISVNI